MATKLTHEITLADGATAEQLDALCERENITLADILKQTTVELPDGSKTRVVSPHDAAELIGVSTGALTKWRAESHRTRKLVGPEFLVFEVGDTVYSAYTIRALQDFIRARMKPPAWAKDSVGSHYSKSGSSPPHGRGNDQGGAK